MAMSKKKKKIVKKPGYSKMTLDQLSKLDAKLDAKLGEPK